MSRKFEKNIILRSKITIISMSLTSISAATIVILLIEIIAVPFMLRALWSSQKIHLSDHDKAYDRDGNQLLIFILISMFSSYCSCPYALCLIGFSSNNLPNVYFLTSQLMNDLLLIIIINIVILRYETYTAVC